MALLDKLGFEINAGDYVCGPYAVEGLGIFEVTRITEKMLKLRNIKAKKEMKDLRYPCNVIKLTDEQVKGLLLTIIKG